MLDMLLPQRCLACGAPGTQLCAACLAAAPRLRPPLCERCGSPTAWPVSRCRECSGRRLAFARARAAVAYDEAIRRLVGGWKERGLRRLAALAGQLVVEVVERPDVDALAALPPDRERLRRRGHHPAAALATELSRRWELPLEPVLARARASRPQRGLSLAERRRNVAGSFSVRGAPPPRRLALVDDVYTSGATADAAARALRRAGARHVEVVTFARTLRTA